MGVYPNNRLMVARRFVAPSGDNIMVNRNAKEVPSIATLVSWIPEGSDFLEISFGEVWTEAKADFTGMLNSLGEALTIMKKKYPIAFVVLSQLNRNIDSPDRQRDGEYGNYVLDSDIYGSDALLQHADVVMGINKPSIRKIRQYGPERFIINDEDMLIFHFLKSRNGTTRISFFKLDRSTMRIVEIDTPPQATKKIAI